MHLDESSERPTKNQAQKASYSLVFVILLHRGVQSSRSCLSLGHWSVTDGQGILEREKQEEELRGQKKKTK